jgi:hypothetical protein
MRSTNRIAVIYKHIGRTVLWLAIGVYAAINIAGFVYYLIKFGHFALGR